MLWIKIFTVGCGSASPQPVRGPVYIILYIREDGRCLKTWWPREQRVNSQQLEVNVAKHFMYLSCLQCRARMLPPSLVVQV